MGWETLPQEVRQELLRMGLRSPDGRWLTATISPTQLWLVATDQTEARLVDRDIVGYAGGVWTPRDTYLYLRGKEDSWQELSPTTGAVTPFLPSLLRGQRAGLIGFSPDGQRLLYSTGVCYCNHPATSPLHTYVANLDGSARADVGVDVDAHWEGTKVVAVPVSPGVVRLQRLKVETTPQGAVWLLDRPVSFWVAVRAAVSVEVRAYAGDLATGTPLATLSAREQEPGTWVVDWGTPPPHPIHLWIYMEVRPEVPDNPAFHLEGGKRWVIYDAGLARVDDQMGIVWKDQVGAADLGCKGPITAASTEEAAHSPFPVIQPRGGFTPTGSSLDACDGRVVSAVAHYRSDGGAILSVAYWVANVHRKPDPALSTQMVELGGQKALEVGSHVLFVQPFGLTEVQSQDLELSRALALALLN